MNKKLVPVLLLGLLVAGVIAVMMIGKDEERKLLTCHKGWLRLSDNTR